MVLIDTSVWIDYFQATESSHAPALESLIRDNNRAMICGIILQEVLQGIRDDKSYTLTKDRLSRLPYLEIDKDTYASSLYRILRTKGITVPPVDVTLAGLAVQRDIPLYTRDEHFKAIAKHSDLKLYNAPATFLKIAVNPSSVTKTTICRPLSATSTSIPSGSASSRPSKN